MFTNNSAVINPVDSNGREYAAQAFNKPTVSYTVAASTTPGDDNNQGKAGKTGKTAKTGDDFPIGLIAGAALLALAGAGAVGFARRRKAN